MSHHVLTAEFIHESNTFKMGLTQLRAFEVDLLKEGDVAIAERGDAPTELAGFLDGAREAGWKVSHVISAHAEPGSKVSREAFDYVADRICAAVEAKKETLDGILLGLHGAMVTEFCEDGEGELLKRIRAIVGDKMPIAITLDLHANATPDMVRDADIIVSYKTYPHVDMRLAGQQAARQLENAMAGNTRPATLRAHRPMLDEVNGGRSDSGPIVPLYEAARKYETEPGILAVSINSGFGEADIRDVGPTVLVTYDSNLPGAAVRARDIAEGIADVIWDVRRETENVYLDVTDAVKIAQDFDTSNGPLIIADYADNPGSGAYGDATNLLKAMIDGALQNATFGPVIDPDAALALSAHPVGSVVTAPIGGKNDPALGGGPLVLTGEIRLISDGNLIGDGPMIGGLHFSFGTSVVFRVAHIDILITTERGQMLDLQQFKAFGIIPEEKSVVALKSMQHFRAAFEPIAGRVIVCDSGALSTPQAHKRPYKNAPRPIFPLDPDLAI
ncbi:M81 family metallopeptidase [Rhizobium sp. RAF56]|jgi:microcystin degradation protein MlrC|uniref:M81 family metallopeptidase n=1 Tax=Rhizobium sp. RAF56 TaxID=3233062 RepID=UPI003F954650